MKSTVGSHQFLNTSEETCK